MGFITRHPVVSVFLALGAAGFVYWFATRDSAPVGTPSDLSTGSVASIGLKTSAQNSSPGAYQGSAAPKTGTAANQNFLQSVSYRGKDFPA
jgi:hypothetical protein